MEELVNDYFYDVDAEKFVTSLNALKCANFFNQVPKVLLWTVIASKKQEHFPSARKLLQHLRSADIVSRLQLESAFRRLFHRLNELSTLNSNAYLILVDFGEYCVARNLLEAAFLEQLQKLTEFAKVCCTFPENLHVPRIFRESCRTRRASSGSRRTSRR